MTLTDTERDAALEKALQDTQGLGTAAQVEAVNRVMMTAPSPETNDKIWLMLVPGLLVLIGLCVIGLFVLLAIDHYNDVVLTVITALVTGFFGLFIPSPTGSK